MGAGAGSGAGSGDKTGLYVVGEVMVSADSLLDGGKEGRNELNSMVRRRGGEFI